MRLEDLYNKFSGSVIVTGCGISSLDLFTNPTNLPIIGVNDSGLLKVPLLANVLLDKPTKFTKSRLDTITDTDCKYFMTHLQEWNILRNQITYFKLGNFDSQTHLKDPGIVDYLNTSVYAAVNIAFKLGFKNIGVIGMDFNNSSLYNNKRHILSDRINYIESGFIKFSDKLLENGVQFFNLSSISKLNKLPYMSYQDFINNFDNGKR